MIKNSISTITTIIPIRSFRVKERYSGMILFYVWPRATKVEVCDLIFMGKTSEKSDELYSD